MSLESLREDIIIKQKKGLPFIIASAVIWGLIAAVSLLDIPMTTKTFWFSAAPVRCCPYLGLWERSSGLTFFPSKTLWASSAFYSL